MIHLKFPPIHKLLEKDTSSYEESDPRNGVLVMKNHAVVMNNKSVVCFDLFEFFTISQDKSTADQIDDLDKILKFMDKKIFGGAFWEELTKGAIIHITESNIEKERKMHLEGAVKKDLFHDYRDFSQEEVIDILKRNVEAPPTGLTRTAFYVEPVQLIMATFKTLLKKDSMALEFIGVNSTIRFTFQENPWLFGVINSDSSLINSNFLFDTIQSFYIDIK